MTNTERHNRESLELLLHIKFIISTITYRRGIVIKMLTNLI